MAKEKTVYVCSNCGQDSPKWVGKCPSCGEWNTYVEEIVRKEPVNRRPVSGIETQKPKPVILSEIIADDEPRINMHDNELNRVLGGGLVPGSLVLIGGEPGIGKSTLVMQTVLRMPEKKILYVSGEESSRQIKLRAARLGVNSENLYILTETDVQNVVEQIRSDQPDLVMIDSIQTMNFTDLNSSPGSVTQVRECTNALMRAAKALEIPILLVGHVNKDGAIAGPKVLEHIVDAVLYFEGDRQMTYRILRAVKNRYGSTNEIGVFEMRGSGLAEVTNPSEYMLQGKPENEPGSIVTCSMEGTRPILVEVQALVCQTSFNLPRRTAAGTDYNRINLLMAVIEKRLGIRMGDCDAYINVAGGMRINEPALDLGIVAALLSSYKNITFDSSTICFGEVGLVGEIRAINMAEQRVLEAAKLGFRTCILPQANKSRLDISKDMLNGMELIGLSTIHELLGVM